MGFGRALWLSFTSNGAGVVTERMKRFYALAAVFCVSGMVVAFVGHPGAGFIQVVSGVLLLVATAVAEARARIRHYELEEEWKALAASLEGEEER